MPIEPIVQVSRFSVDFLPNGIIARRRPVAQLLLYQSSRAIVSGCLSSRVTAENSQWLINRACCTAYSSQRIRIGVRDDTILVVDCCSEPSSIVTHSFKTRSLYQSFELPSNFVAGSETTSMRPKWSNVELVVIVLLSPCVLRCSICWTTSPAEL